MILYEMSQFDNYLLFIITEKVTIKRVMQIHNIMVLIFNACAVINHLFFTLWSFFFLN